MLLARVWQSQCGDLDDGFEIVIGSCVLVCSTSRPKSGFLFHSARVRAAAGGDCGGKYLFLERGVGSFG